MKRVAIILAVFVAFGLTAVAQTKHTSSHPAQATAPTPQPVLGTAERIAIQSLEQKKTDAQKQFQEAWQMEQSIEREFAAAHPGWHVNPQNFAVERDAVVPAKPAAKK